MDTADRPTATNLPSSLDSQSFAQVLPELAHSTIKAENHTTWPRAHERRTAKGEMRWLVFP